MGIVRQHSKDSVQMYPLPQVDASMVLGVDVVGHTFDS